MITMDTIFIIGSNSFSGATFAKHALAKGFSVIGISRSDELIDVFLPYKWIDHANFSFYPLDLNKHLSDIISLIHEVRPAYVVNFAAQSMVAESWLNPGDWFMTNTVSTVKLHDELRKCNFIKRYVHISTPEVYGSTDKLIKESFNSRKKGNDSLADSLDKSQKSILAKKYLATVSFALLNNDYEVAPYLMVSRVNDVKTSYLDSVYNQLTPNIKDSKYGNDLESLIQFRNKNKIN